MMTMRKWLIVAGALLLAATPVVAGNQDVRTFDLFIGSAGDSTEQASRWIPIRGAAKVFIRSYTFHAAFTGSGSGDVDSTTSDSIAGFRLLLSDSVSFIGRDSTGTLVTARSTYTASNAVTFPVCADSFEVPITTNGDTTTKLVRYTGPPVNKALRTAANGSGLYTMVCPARVAVGTAVDPDVIIPAGFMRVRYTPVRRLTSQMSSSTAGARVNGLKNLRMIAYVVYVNR